MCEENGRVGSGWDGVGCLGITRLNDQDYKLVSVFQTVSVTEMPQNAGYQLS